MYWSLIIFFTALSMFILLLMQWRLWIKLINIRKNHLSFTFAGTQYALFIAGFIIFLFSLLLLFSENFFSGIVWGTISLILMMLCGNLSIKNIGVKNQQKSQQNDPKLILIMTIIVDLIVVFCVFWFTYDFYHTKEVQGYNKLSREQAIAIANQDINPGVKSEVTYTKQSNGIFSEYGYIWNIIFRLYDKRGNIIGGHEVYVDNKEGRIIYDQTRKIRCQLLFNQQPVQNGEVMAIDTENRADGTNVYSAKSVDDYGFTDNEGKINISLNTEGNSYVTVIDSSGVARIKTFIYNQSTQGNCIIDYTNVQPINLQYILK